MERHPVYRLRAALRVLALVAAAVVMAGCTTPASNAVGTAPAASQSLPSALDNPLRRPCTPEWFAYVETHYSALGEEQVHDPNLGSDAWLDAFERRRHLPSTSGQPREARCAHLARELDYRY